MTDEDKGYIETWRRNNGATTVKRCAKTQLRSKTKKKATGKGNVTCCKNVDNQGNSTSASLSILPADISGKIASNAATIVNPTVSSSANSSVSNSVESSTIFSPLSSPNAQSSICRVESVTPSLTQSVPESFAITSNSNIVSILPLVEPSFYSTDTVQSSASATLNSNIQPSTHDFNLSVSSCDNLTYSSFVSGLQTTSEGSRTAIDLSSFSLESTNSNTFSFTRPSLDSVGQTEFPVSSPVRSPFRADVSSEEFVPPHSPNNIIDLLPGNVISESPPNIDQINEKVDYISEKIDAVLTNQHLIIDCLKNNGFMSSNAPSTTIPTIHNTKELTTAELEALNNSKKKGTTNAHFAVILLKKYTTQEERMNCTVHGEGRKSKGLKIETLARIKKGYETIYSSESWSDAVSAMNSHLRKYCSTKDN